MVGVAAFAVILLRVLLRVVNLDVVLAVPELVVVALGAQLVPVVVLLRQVDVVLRRRHLLGRAERRQVERADEGVRAVDADVVGVRLLALDNAVAVAVVDGHDVVHRPLDLRPGALEPFRIGAPLVLPVGLQDHAEQPVQRRIVRAAYPALPRPGQVERQGDAMGQVAAGMQLVE